MKTHKRIVYNKGGVPIPSKALCGSSGKRTSSVAEVTCLACQKIMRAAAMGVNP